MLLLLRSHIAFPLSRTEIDARSLFLSRTLIFNCFAICLNLWFTFLATALCIYIDRTAYYGRKLEPIVFQLFDFWAPMGMWRKKNVKKCRVSRVKRTNWQWFCFGILICVHWWDRPSSYCIYIVCNHKFITDINEIPINYTNCSRTWQLGAISISAWNKWVYIMSKMIRSRKCHLSLGLSERWSGWCMCCFTGSVLISYWNIYLVWGRWRYKFFFEHGPAILLNINLSFGWQPDIDHLTAHYSHLFVFAEKKKRGAVQKSIVQAKCDLSLNFALHHMDMDMRYVALAHAHYSTDQFHIFMLYAKTTRTE